MLRDQSSLPAKSNPLITPVPVITQTPAPSVTGDGVDMFCLRIRLLPPPSSRFQTTAPVARSTAQRNISLPADTLRKMRSPQTIGVDADHAGIASFQAMFSVLLHLTGRLVSPLAPLSIGPRHCGQFSAATVAVTTKITNTAPAN